MRFHKFPNGKRGLAIEVSTVQKPPDSETVAAADSVLKPPAVRAAYRKYPFAAVSACGYS